MGLDIHMIICDPADITEHNAIVYPVSSHCQWKEIGYWRGDWGLQTLLSGVFQKKGGTVGDYGFNNIPIRLTLEEATQLNLPAAQRAIQQGYAVVIGAWY